MNSIKVRRKFLGISISGDPFLFLDEVWGEDIRQGRVKLQDIRRHDPTLVSAIYRISKQKGLSPFNVLPASNRAALSVLSPQERKRRDRLKATQRMQDYRRRLKEKALVASHS
ncbi:MAG: hypothetical protein WAO98_09385 [Alphaproteobacteria bacterium]